MTNNNTNNSVRLERKDFMLIVLLLAGINTGELILDKKAFPERPDPYTGTQAKQLEKDLKAFSVKSDEFSKREVFLRIAEVEKAIRDDMPPAATKARIANIEQHLQEKDGYKPVTYEWN